MRVREIRGGLQAYITNEEQMLVDLIEKNNGIIEKSKLHERFQELARQLTSRCILNRRKFDDKIYYLINMPEDIWRI